MRKFVYSLYVLLYFGHITTAQIPVERLGNYNVDPDSISVSGFSSGGSFATQFHFSYSALIKGAGIFAAYGPYLCQYDGAESAQAQACIQDPNQVNVGNILERVYNFSSSNKIDDVGNLNGSRAYILSGTRDMIVKQASLRLSSLVYKHFKANVQEQFAIPVGHGIPVNNGRGGVCASNLNEATAYLNECGYNSVFQMLNWLYGGNLVAPPLVGVSQPTGKLIPFLQSEFLKESSSQLAKGMGGNGHAYVPAACLRGSEIRCRLHVVFRECSSGPNFAEEEQKLISQYAEVADLNNIIMLHPALEHVLISPTSAICWDSIGETGQSTYATKDGAQATIIYKMIQRVLGKF